MDAGLLIVWAGDGEAPTAVNVGNERIELPPADEQREPFEHERAVMLVSLNMGWKTFIGRGE